MPTWRGKFWCASMILAASLGPALAGSKTEQFHLDAAASTITIHVGRSGIFGFAGHDHEVIAPAVRGIVTVDRSDLSASRVELEFDAAALKVTGRGEPAEDVPEVQRVMETEVLEVERYPTITFQSERVSVVEQSGERATLGVVGRLALHGVTRPVTVPVSVELRPDALAAKGRLEIRHTDFGLKRVSAGAGTVRVKDELEITFDVTARRQ